MLVHIKHYVIAEEINYIQNRNELIQDLSLCYFIMEFYTPDLS